MNRTLPAELKVYGAIDFSKLKSQRAGIYKKFKANIIKVISSDCLDFVSEHEPCVADLRKLNFIQSRLVGMGQTVGVVPVFTTEGLWSRYANVSDKFKFNQFTWNPGLDVDSKFRNQFESDDVKNINEYFFLIDKKGQIRGFYDSSKNSVNKLLIDLGLLINFYQEK